MEASGSFLEDGKSYIISVPPGWLFVGTVAAQSATHIKCSKCVWLEAAGDSVFTLCSANDAKKVRQIIPKASSMAGMVFQKDCVTFCAPVPDLVAVALYDSKALSAIEDAE